MELNFTLKELYKSSTASRHGISNRPGSKVAKKLMNLIRNVLQPVRNHFGPVVVNSGYRGLKLNRLIKGSKNSQHCKGEAADFEVPGTSNKIVADWIRDNLGFDQLILEFYDPKDPRSGWVHCSLTEKDNRHQCLRAVKVRGKTKYLKELD